MILLFTDFGVAGPYVGQMKSVLLDRAPGVAVVDLQHDAPAFRPNEAGYLLAALMPYAPPSCVMLCVVDPGVGTDRRPVVVRLGDRWLVGPDNGLFAPALRRAARDRAWREAWVVDWRPEHLSRSFHGRDLFAPVAARLAAALAEGARGLDLGAAAGIAATAVTLESLVMPPDDSARIVYVDGYGNAMTGLEADTLSEDTILRVADQSLRRAGTFGEVPVGTPFWYENAVGLAEVAVREGSAATVVGLAVGDPVSIEGASDRPPW